MKAVVIDCIVKGEKNSPIGEMDNLLRTLGVDVDVFVSQNLDSINQSIYMGSGMLASLAQYIKANDINLLVFNNDLSPLQIRNISEVCDVQVLDRSMVIIKIFEMRASSKEARLQVEIAALKYNASRLIDKDKNYAQMTSGGAGGVTNRGSGEKAINVQKFRIREMICRKEEELQKVVNSRKNQRSRRDHSLPVVAIVGYTNAGKSTLMNTFIKMTENVKKDLILQEDRLFATLTTTTRYIKVGKYYPFLLTDTVGFISNLPTTLIKAFRSTLEEILEADVLIHVVDVSSPNFIDEMKVTKDTLEEIGVKDKKEIFIYNKIDLLQNGQPIPFIGENDVLVSLKEGTDINIIQDVIDNVLQSFYVELQLFIPYEESEVYFEIRNSYSIIESKEIEYGYDVICKIDRKQVKKYQKYLIMKSTLGIEN